jgi:hypothetical protein
VRVGVAVMVGVGVWAANVRPGVGRHGDVGSGVGTGGRATALTFRSKTSDPTERSCVVPALVFLTRRSAWSRTTELTRNDPYAAGGAHCGVGCAASQ